MILELLIAVEERGRGRIQLFRQSIQVPFA